MIKSLQSADQNHPLKVHYLGATATYINSPIVRDAIIKDIGYFNLDSALKKYIDQIHFEGEKKKTSTDVLKLPVPGKSKKMSL